MNLRNLLAIALLTGTTCAQNLPFPAGLQPGDPYRIMFVTDSSRNATSSNIEDYNQFVTADAVAVPALAALNTTWYAVASAEGSALWNTSTGLGGGVPIYRPDGVRLANNYDHLWGTSNGAPLLAAPNITASGAVAPSSTVWTGSSSWGGNIGSGLGSSGPFAGTGNCTATSSSWIWGTSEFQSQNRPLYGMSDILTAPFPEYPTDLRPGDSFRILCVTDTTRDATSSDIADYDAFATADALAVQKLQKFGATWKALVSTPSISAKVHTGTDAAGGVPIYRPDGVRVADNYTHLWGTVNGPQLLVAPNLTSSGAVQSVWAWTGSYAEGVPNQPLGGSGGMTFAGDPLAVGYSWMWSSDFAQSESRPLYAISSVITVPQPQHPAGLQPGDQYRVLLVTEGTRDATSDNIADYDAFVQAEAESVQAIRLLGAQWSALASTPSVSAAVHTGTAGGGGLPIYRPDGVRVFNDYAHLWGTTTTAPLATPNLTPSGLPTTATEVWSGHLSARLRRRPARRLHRAVQLWQPARTRSGVEPERLPVAERVPPALTPCPPPSECHTRRGQDVRPGTPPNPSALLPGQTSPPVIGGSWDPIIDHTTFVTNAALDFAMFGGAQLNVPVPNLGTVLTDQAFGSMTATPGQTFLLAIPNDSGLLGLQMSVQGLTLDWNWGLHLTNAHRHGRRHAMRS